MRKLVLASMLAAFAAAVTLPAIIAPETAVAAEKKKTKMKIHKKKPTQKM